MQDKLSKVTSYRSAASQYRASLRRLEKLDLDSQRLTSANLPQSRVQTLIAKSTEGIFLSLFTEYERFIENILVLSVLGKRLPSGKSPQSFLKPRTYDHALKLIIGDKDFGSWNHPSNVITVAERVLNHGYPVKDVIVSIKEPLQRSLWARNRIAHLSDKSQRQFANAVRQEISYLPVGNISVGDFLNIALPSNKRVIQTYFDTYLKIADDLELI